MGEHQFQQQVAYHGLAGKALVNPLPMPLARSNPGLERPFPGGWPNDPCHGARSTQVPCNAVQELQAHSTDGFVWLPPDWLFATMPAVHDEFRDRRRGEQGVSLQVDHVCVQRDAPEIEHWTSSSEPPRWAECSPRKRDDILRWRGAWTHASALADGVRVSGYASCACADGCACYRGVPRDAPARCRPAARLRPHGGRRRGYVAYGAVATALAAKHMLYWGRHFPVRIPPLSSGFQCCA